MATYLSVKSKFSIQSYAQRVDQPTEEMGAPFLPPGVKKSGREANTDLVMQAKGRKVQSQLKDYGGFHDLTDTIPWL